MGLFDKLKKTVEDIAAEAGRNKDDLQKEIEKVLGQRPQQTQPSSTSGRTVNASSQTVSDACARYPETTDQTQRIYEILTRRFPQFEVRCNVPVNSLLPAAHPKCIPITYLLCQNSTPKMAVILMHQKQHGGMNQKGTDAACVQLGIPYMHLYHEYENAENYIAEKINQAI